MPARPSWAPTERARSANALELEALYSHEAFLSLRSAWKSLTDADPRASIFMTHEWTDAAWAWRSQDDTPLILVLREDQQVVGLAPLLERDTGKGSVQLSWLSVPDNQEADVICAPAARARLTRAVTDWLKDNDRRWSRLALGLVPADSPNLPALAAALRERGIPAASVTIEPNHAINLTSGWDAFYASRSRRLKKGNNLVANRLQRSGEVEVARLTGADITPEIRETLRRLSAGSWKHETSTTFDHPAPGAFLDTLIEHGRRSDWLVVWLLKLDGEALASELHLEFNGRAHALRADYAEHAAELSPGTYLNWKIIERLFDSGLYRYEMGPGNNPYKQRWADDRVHLARLDAWPATIAGRANAMWHMHLRPALAGLARRAGGLGRGRAGTWGRTARERGGSC